MSKHILELADPYVLLLSYIPLIDLDFLKRRAYPNSAPSMELANWLSFGHEVGTMSLSRLGKIKVDILVHCTTAYYSIAFDVA